MVPERDVRRIGYAFGRRVYFVLAGGELVEQRDY